jgi:5-methylcytosine-specific restriction endonuclease McrA
MIRGISKSAVLVIAVLLAMCVGAQIANYIGPDKFAYACRSIAPQDLLQAIEYNINRESLGDAPQTSHRVDHQPRASNHHWLEQSLPATQSTRMTRRVSETLKKTVAHRQRYHCAGCRQMLPPSYQVDHIIPLYTDVYGTHTDYLNSGENLQALCPNCHSVKTQQDLIKYKGMSHKN